MCGRFTQHYTWEEVHAFLSVFGTPRNLQPHYNIAPTDTIDVTRLGPQSRELVPMRWGFIPGWWKKAAKEMPATFNARAKSVAEKPMFRNAFKKRRCIIPASIEPRRQAGAAGSPTSILGLTDRLAPKPLKRRRIPRCANGPCRLASTVLSEV